MGLGLEVKEEAEGVAAGSLGEVLSGDGVDSFGVEAEVVAGPCSHIVHLQAQTQFVDADFAGERGGEQIGEHHIAHFQVVGGHYVAACILVGAVDVSATEIAVGDNGEILAVAPEIEVGRERVARIA